MTTTTQFALEKEASCSFSLAAQRTMSSGPLLCCHLTIWGPPRPCANISSPHPSPCLRLPSTSPFPLSLRVTSAEVRLRADRAQGWVWWLERGQARDPALPAPSLPPFHTHHSSFQSQNNSPSPSLDPHLSGAWLETPKPCGQASAHQVPQSQGGAGRSKAQSPLLPIPVGSGGRTGYQLGWDSRASAQPLSPSPRQVS